MTTQLHNKRVPETVQVAFRRVSEFSLSSQESPIFRDQINIDTKRESKSKAPLLLDSKGLTGGMLSSCIDPVLVEVNKFNKLSDEFDISIRPHLPKIEALVVSKDKINDLQIESENTQFNIEKKHAAKLDYSQAKDAYERLKEQYDEMYNAEGQREAKNFSPTLYFLILIVIGAIEWLINYSSFLEFYSVPAMAAGFTFAISLAVACASHWHGSRLKGSAYFFGDHVDLGERKKELLAISVATIALVIAICYVGWVRYSWAIDLVAQLGVNSGISIEQDNNLPSINVGQKVIVSLIANILVWFIGAAFAYAVHDKNPRFTEKLREYNKANKAYLSKHKPVQAEIRQKRSQLAHEIEVERNKAKAINDDATPLAEMLQTKDAKNGKINSEANRLANALIRNYRSTLGSISAISNPTLQFNQDGKLIDLETYRQINTKYTLQNTLEK